MFTHTKVGYLHLASWLICERPGLLLMQIRMTPVFRNIKKKVSGGGITLFAKYNNLSQ